MMCHFIHMSIMYPLACILSFDYFVKDLARVHEMGVQPDCTDIDLIVLKAFSDEEERGMIVNYCRKSSVSNRKGRGNALCGSSPKRQRRDEDDSDSEDSDSEDFGCPEWQRIEVLNQESRRRMFFDCRVPAGLCVDGYNHGRGPPLLSSQACEKYEVQMKSSHWQGNEDGAVGASLDTSTSGTGGGAAAGSGVDESVSAAAARDSWDAILLRADKWITPLLLTTVEFSSTPLEDCCIPEYVIKSRTRLLFLSLVQKVDVLLKIFCSSVHVLHCQPLLAATVYWVTRSVLVQTYPMYFSTWNGRYVMSNIVSSLVFQIFGMYVKDACVLLGVTAGERRPLFDEVLRNVESMKELSANEDELRERVECHRKGMDKRLLSMCNGTSRNHRSRGSSRGSVRGSSRGSVRSDSAMDGSVMGDDNSWLLEDDMYDNPCGVDFAAGSESLSGDSLSDGLSASFTDENVPISAGDMKSVVDEILEGVIDSDDLEDDDVIQRGERVKGARVMNLIDADAAGILDRGTVALTHSSSFVSRGVRFHDNSIGMGKRPSSAVGLYGLAKKGGFVRRDGNLYPVELSSRGRPYSKESIVGMTISDRSLSTGMDIEYSVVDDNGRAIDESGPNPTDKILSCFEESEGMPNDAKSIAEPYPIQKKEGEGRHVRAYLIPSAVSGTGLIGGMARLYRDFGPLPRIQVQMRNKIYSKTPLIRSMVSVKASVRSCRGRGERGVELVNLVPGVRDYRMRSSLNKRVGKAVREQYLDRPPSRHCVRNASSRQSTASMRGAMGLYEDGEFGKSRPASSSATSSSVERPLKVNNSELNCSDSDAVIDFLSLPRSTRLGKKLLARVGSALRTPPSSRPSFLKKETMVSEGLEVTEQPGLPNGLVNSYVGSVMKNAVPSDYGVRGSEKPRLIRASVQLDNEYVGVEQNSSSRRRRRERNANVVLEDIHSARGDVHPNSGLYSLDIDAALSQLKYKEKDGEIVRRVDGNVEMDILHGEKEIMSSRDMLYRAAHSASVASGTGLSMYLKVTEPREKLESLDPPTKIVDIKTLADSVKPKEGIEVVEPLPHKKKCTRTAKEQRKAMERLYMPDESSRRTGRDNLREKTMKMEDDRFVRVGSEGGSVVEFQVMGTLGRVFFFGIEGVLKMVGGYFLTKNMSRMAESINVAFRKVHGDDYLNDHGRLVLEDDIMRDEFIRIHLQKLKRTRKREILASTSRGTGACVTLGK